MLNLQELKITCGKPEQVIIYDVMDAIVLYMMTQSECGTDCLQQ